MAVFSKNIPNPYCSQEQKYAAQEKFFLNTVYWLLIVIVISYIRSAFLSPGHRLLHHLLPATCQSPPGLAAAPAVWPFTASAYPSPRLRQQNQLMSDGKPETCSLNFWALFLFISLCDHKTIFSTDPWHLRSSGEIFEDTIMFLCLTVHRKWKIYHLSLLMYLKSCLYPPCAFLKLLLSLRYFVIYWLHFPDMDILT